MKPKREGLKPRVAKTRKVVKHCGRKTGQNQVNCRIAEKIAELAEAQKIAAEKIGKMAESHKVLVEKIDFIHDQLVGKISTNEGHAKRIASNLIEWKRKSQIEWNTLVKQTPPNQRIPQTPPNPLVSQLTEKRMNEMGMLGAEKKSQMCRRCGGLFRHVVVSKLCGECHRQNCESAATFFASATSATPAEFMPSLKPYGLREHFDESRDSAPLPPSLHPSLAPVVTIPPPPPGELK